MECYVCGKQPIGWSGEFEEWLCLSCVYDAVEPDPDDEDAISSSET